MSVTTEEKIIKSLFSKWMNANRIALQRRLENELERIFTEAYMLGNKYGKAHESLNNSVKESIHQMRIKALEAENQRLRKELSEYE